jgi:hypothetical protein
VYAPSNGVCGASSRVLGLSAPVAFLETDAEEGSDGEEDEHNAQEEENRYGRL